jgi:hypothetical protein
VIALLLADKPVGKPVTLTWYVPEPAPPVAWTVWLKEAPCSAEPGQALVMRTGAGCTVMLQVIVADELPLEARTV